MGSDSGGINSDKSKHNVLTPEERRELLPLQGSKNKIWDHFEFLAHNGKYSEHDKKKCNYHTV